MSYIGGKPFIDRCLDSLSDSEIRRLRSIANNSNALPTGNYCLYGPSGVKLTDVLSDYNKFAFVNLGYDWILNYYHIGFLIRLGTNEWGFLVWQPYSLLMNIVQLKQAKDKAEFNVIQEQLTAEEFRRVLNDLNDTDEKLEELIASMSAGNIDIESMQQLNVDPEGLTNEQVEQLKGKCWYSISWEAVIYPLYVDEVRVDMFAFDGSNIGSWRYYKDSDDEWEYNDAESKVYELPNMSGLGLIWMDNPSEEIGEERFEKLLTGKYCIGGWAYDDFVLYMPYYTELNSDFIEFYRFSTFSTDKISLYHYTVRNSGISLNDMYDDEEVSEVSRTKLYKHELQDSSYKFVLINSVSRAINFAQMHSYSDFNDYLNTNGYISFKYNNDDILWDSPNSYFSIFYAANGSLTVSDLSDWDLSGATDTVTEL